MEIGICYAVYKKGSCNLVSNYHPTSLMSATVKIMESTSKDNLLQHMLTYDLISPFQYRKILFISLSNSFKTNSLAGYGINVIWPSTLYYIINYYANWLLLE